MLTHQNGIILRGTPRTLSNFKTRRGRNLITILRKDKGFLIILLMCASFLLAAIFERTIKITFRIFDQQPNFSFNSTVAMTEK